MTAVFYRIGDPLPDVLEVRQGTEIAIALTGTAAYSWAPVESLSPQVVAVDAAKAAPAQGENASGTAQSVTRARAVAVGAGRAQLRSTASFRGDRFGPRTLLWRLTVVVSDEVIEP